ncbi:MAG: hypothetical protein MK108_04440 [Mariniblastus sp.]|nr:hypothetical protein [Mariniblastus sp.]
MIFDQTFIAIRQRNIFEILDLSIHVIRNYCLPLSVLLLINALPFFLLDWLLFRWMLTGISAFGYAPLYLWLTSLMVASQAQLGTLLITGYLGKALFQGHPSIKETILAALRIWPQLFWIHGILRTAIPTILIGLYLSQTESTGAVILLTLVVSVGLLVRWLRPFATEMLLLEQNPLRSSDPATITYRMRSAALHNIASSTITGRFLLISLLALPLIFSFYSSILLTDQAINLHIDPDATLITFYWPLSLWLVAGFLAVVRFLSYLDIRIRQEGWAVELRIRAEATRLNKNLLTR